MTESPLLSVRDLVVEFPTRRGTLLDMYPKGPVSAQPYRRGDHRSA